MRPASGISAIAEPAVTRIATITCHAGDLAERDPRRHRHRRRERQERGDHRERPVRVVEHREGQEEAHEDHERQRQRRRLQLLLARHERPRTGERARVERVAEHEPGERERGGHEDVAVDVERPERRRQPQADDGDEQELGEPEQPEADHLAGEQLARAHGREQDLHDARALLLHHAARDEVAEGQQLA